MAVPAITAISPSGGPAAGGTTVTIAGTNLGTPTAVAFGATPATAFAGLSATQAVAIAPAGTGTVHVTLTTAGGTSATSAVDEYTYATGLFTVAEARAFDKAQLADTAYSDAAITAKEAEIREWFTKVCGVAFLPTTATDELHDGDSTNTLLLDWPRPITVSAISIDGTALTATELLTTDYSAGLAVYPTGKLVRRSGVFTRGEQNVLVTYSHGHATVPALIKDAALRIAVVEIPTSSLGMSTDAYDSDGQTINFALGDGFNDNWSRIPEVRRAIRMYNERLPGIA
jgi:hypothetical protein